MKRQMEWAMSAVLVTGLSVAVGCDGGAGEEPGLGGESEALNVQPPAICADNTGKWQHLANLAVATADELGELNPSKQFTLVSFPGEEQVALSPYGQAACAARGGCPQVEGLLGLQSLANDQEVSQDIFNTIDYRLSLVAMFRQQQQQTAQLSANHRYDLLPEDHVATLLGQDGTATCGSPWYAFQVTGVTGAPLLHPETLCQALWMFGGATACGGSNPYLDFVVVGEGGKFKIDPTDYNNGGITTTSSGSCVSSLPYVSLNYSVGKCCYYHGVYGTLQKVSTRPYTYYCRI
jgi:hypothetical protein